MKHLFLFLIVKKIHIVIKEHNWMEDKYEHFKLDRYLRISGDKNCIDKVSQLRYLLLIYNIQKNW